MRAQTADTAHHRYVWEHEYSGDYNFYSPESAAVDSAGILWILCGARMGNEDYTKQRVTHAVFRVDADGRQLSTFELDLGLSPDERRETSDYRLAPSGNGGMALVFNRMQYFQPRGAGYMGAFFTTLRADGTASPVEPLLKPGSQINDLLALAGGDLLLGSEGALIAFDPAGQTKWKSSFRSPWLLNFDLANLADGNVCSSAWTMSKRGALNRLRVMKLGAHGQVLQSAEIHALRGSVAGAPDGACGVLYDRAPSVFHGDYNLTQFDHSFTRPWTVPVPESSASGATFDLAALTDGYLVQIGDALAEYGWSGQRLWTEKTRGGSKTITVAGKDGFFVIEKDLQMNNGFHVKRAVTTPGEAQPER